MTINFLDKSKNIYLVGIKGVGMTALAQILMSQGKKISGSDTHEKFFTDKGLSYYVNANAGGSGSVVAWGQFTPATINGSIPTSTTVFSNNAEEGNEAIVEMVLSYAKQRGKKTKESLAHKSEAVRLLNELWGRIEDEQYQYQVPPNDGMFERFDVLEGALTDDLFRRDQFN